MTNLDDVYYIAGHGHDVDELIEQLPREHSVDWNDGSIWFIRWMRDCGGYNDDRWFNTDDPTEDPLPERSCPGPEDGVFATVEAIEVAMGERLPDAMRDRLADESRWHPLHEDDKPAWGRTYAFEVTHLLDDGTLVSTWAPPWADNPLDPAWDPEWC